MKELQDIMPWTELWSDDYKKDCRSYKDFEHCIINIVAKAGAILQRIEMADHYGDNYELALNKEKDATALAIIIMSTLKAANVYPKDNIDIQKYINRDLKRRGVFS